MNKSIVFFLAFFVCFSSIYAFDIYNSNNEISQYFSINNDEIKIISENLNENLIINYKINDRDYNKSYNFENINNQNQVIFKLSELNQIQEGQLTTASSYKLKVGNQEKIIYIDFKKPEFNLLETNLTNGEVNFKFNYSDELSGIKNIDLYINKNNQKIYITNLKDKTEYTYKLTEIGIYEFTFRTYDNVENYIEIKKKINVTDFFAPKISELFIEKSETNKYQLHLKVTDDVEIDSYHLKQGNLDLTENINEKVLDKKIGLPFLTTELIKLIVVDSSGNKIEKTIDLSKTIKINNFLKYINEKKIEFTTNSDKCNLISVNSNNINKEFEKDNSKFELRTSKLSSNEPNNIMFSCEKDGFREYFEKELIYDIKDPEKITINAEKTEKGSIYLDWEKSEDESGVEYEIYRNDKKQETTDSTNYEDFDVEYPNKYEYFVKVIDGAGNSIESNKIEQSPKKVKIYFKDFIENKIETNESKFVYDFETELGITLTVKQLFDNMIINEKKIEIKNKKNKFEFDLEVGENEIEINGEDYVGNKLLIKKTIIYENKLIVLDKKQDNQILLENKENEENNIIQNE